MTLELWLPVMVGGTLAGSSTGLLGGYIVGMRMPFLGVCVAHAALAGAVFGALAGLTDQELLAPAMVAALGTAMLVGLLDPERLRTDSNIVLGVLFSLSMGIAFLGMGLFGRYGVPDNEVRALLWGSLAVCKWRHVWLIAAVAAASLGFVLLFGKEMRAVLFSRFHARAAGIHATVVWSGFLALTAAALTVNFQTVGGLMIYSLMTNPAVAAFTLVKGHGKAMTLATLLGALSGLGGFLLAFVLDLPVGPVIVIFSSLLVVLAFAARRIMGGRRGAR